MGSPRPPVRIIGLRRSSRTPRCPTDFLGWYCLSSTRVVVVLGGELDRRSARQLKSLLARVDGRGPETVTIDLRRVLFVDVTAARTILEWAGDATRRGSPVTITGPPRLFPLMARGIGVPVVVESGPGSPLCGSRRMSPTSPRVR